MCSPKIWCNAASLASLKSVVLGKQLSRDVIKLPGGHVGYVTQPDEFAHELVQTLARAGHGPKV